MSRLPGLLIAVLLALAAGVGAGCASKPMGGGGGYYPDSGASGGE